MENLTSQIEDFYKEFFHSFDSEKRLPAVKLEFYPYVGINSRIRLRDGALIVRISDALRDAGLEFQRALAEILVRKLFRRKIPAAVSQIYRDFVTQAEIRDKSITLKQTRGRKVLSGAQGAVYDLEKIFDLLNQLYFKNSIEKPALTWSQAKTYRILGHHDAAHAAIVISRTLDDAQIPRFVVEYVVYHEMLHIKHPTKYLNGRRYNHTPAFRRDEEEFAFFSEAEKWIETNAATLRRRVKKSRRKS